MARREAEVGEHEQAAVARVEADRAYYLKEMNGAAFLNRWTRVLVLLVSASVPAAVAVWPDAPEIAAVLGALVTVLTGLRAAFHWEANFVRFARTFVALDRQLATFEVRGEPYEDPATRAQLLVEAANRLVVSETTAWEKTVGKPPGGSK